MFDEPKPNGYEMRYTIRYPDARRLANVLCSFVMQQKIDPTYRDYLIYKLIQPSLAGDTFWEASLEGRLEIYFFDCVNHFVYEILPWPWKDKATDPILMTIAEEFAFFAVAFEHTYGKKKRDRLNSLFA